MLGGYTTGTVSITAGASVAVGTSVIWNGANAREGDTLIVAGHQVIVNEVTDIGNLAIDAWPYSTVTAVPYRLAFTSPLRYGANAQLAKDVSGVLAVLNATGFFVFVGIDEIIPDPSLGEDGQFALQPSTKKQWHKEAGLWVFDGIFGGFGIPAPYDNTATYSLFDVATSGGSSYIFINSTPSSGHVPPNATYWAVLAAKGDPGATGATSWAVPVAWLTATAFVAAAPSSVVVINGSTYVCLVAHTSGTFATDLAAGKWLLVAQAAPIYNVSSTASLLIAIASKAFTGIATNNAYQIGDYVRAKSAANGVNYMEGNVTANASGTLTVNVTKIGGSGTFADWNISPTGAPGTGDVLSTNNGSEFTNKLTTANNLQTISYGGAQSLTAAQQNQAQLNLAIPLATYGLITGLYLSTAGGSSTFSVASGVAPSAAGSDTIISSGTISKTTGAWVVGNGNGGLDTSTIAINTWYHIHLIKNPTTQVVDVLISLSATAPTMPTGYTQRRRLGAMKTNASSQWIKFSQLRSKFLWDVPTLDDVTAVGTTAALITLNAPTGIQVEAEIYGLATNAAAGTVWLITSPDQADTLPSASGPFSGIIPIASANTPYSQRVRTDTSGRIRKRASAATTTIYINTFGWDDARDS